MITKLSCGAEFRLKWVIQPTRSMTWKEARHFILLVTVISISIGTWFWSLGFPMILPFSGLEALAVAAAFYVVLRDGEKREVVSISDREIIVEKGRLSPELRESFELAWVRIHLINSPLRWHPTRLFLESHGRSVELGDFLTNGERESIAFELINAIKKNR